MILKKDGHAATKLFMIGMNFKNYLLAPQESTLIKKMKQMEESFISQIQ